MRRHSNIEGLLFPVFAGASVLLIGGGLVTLANLHDQRDLWNDQSTELESNPAVFAITRPEQRPEGNIVASWEAGGYDGTYQFTLSIGANGEASLSDPYQPTAVVGRHSAPIVSCSSLNIEVHATHSFEREGQLYQALLTKVGNAAVCSVDN